MCDLTPVRNWLVATLFAIFAVVGIIIAASIANGSFFLAWTAPAFMLAAAAVTGVAILFLALASSALDTFCKCAGPSCDGPCGNLKNVLAAAKVVLGIQATACLAAALIAWIPVAGLPLMWTILGALVVQAALIISAFAFLSQLSRCQLAPMGAPPAPPTAPR